MPTITVSWTELYCGYWQMLRGFPTPGEWHDCDMCGKAKELEGKSV